MSFLEYLLELVEIILFYHNSNNPLKHFHKKISILCHQLNYLDKNSTIV